MKKRIIALILTLSLLLCCGCGAEKKPTVKNESIKKPQAVISMNPSVIQTDGTVESARKAVSSGMSADITTGGATLYESSDWYWAYITEDLEYIQRTIRGLESFKDGSGSSTKNAPYAYTVTDDRTSSISVYDTSKVEMEGYGSDSIAGQGILLAVTGDQKEAFVYTAESDCTLSFGDTENGNISLIKSVASMDTDLLASDSPIGVVVGIYANNRLLWQEVLGNDALLGTAVTSVVFPTVSQIEMSAGDSFVITVQLTHSADGIETGSFPMPDGTSVVTTPIKVGYEVEIENLSTGKNTNTDKKPSTGKNENQNQNQNSATTKAEKIYLLNSFGVSNFGIVTSSKVSATINAMAIQIRDAMEETTGEDVVYRRDNAEISSEYKILLGDTVYAESKAAISEIKAKRDNCAMDFIIRFSGKNLVIAAVTDFGMQKAVDYFINTYCKEADSYILSDLEYISSEHSEELKNVKIAGNSISKYKIVYSHIYSYIEAMAIDELIEKTAKVTGYELQTIEDREPTEAFEIVIGTTTRTSSDYFNKATTTDNYKYSITVKNNKMYVWSDQAHGVNAAILYLISQIEKGTSFANGYSYNGKYDGGYSLTNGYKLAWSDEFNGTELSDVWRPMQGFSKMNHLGGLQKSIPENNYVENGTLVQKVYADGLGNTYGATIDSDSNEPLWFQYGYLEYRVKFPTTMGIEHAFWTSARNNHLFSYFIEVDLVETGGDVFRHHQTIHQWTHAGRVDMWGISNNKYTKYGTDEPVPVGYEYHTIGYEWDDDKFAFYSDGKFIGELDVSDPKFEFVDNPLLIRIDTVTYNNLGVSSKVLIDESFVEDYTYIDYIRIYQKDEKGYKLSNIHNVE